MRKTLIFLTILLAACTSVDSTEHCVLTRYGDVVKDKMGNGLTWTPIADATCFPLTDQKFPDAGQPTTIEASTADPVRVGGELEIVYAYANIPELFKEKRTHAAAHSDVISAVASGYSDAMAAWKIDGLFSGRQSEFGDSVAAHIQKKLGKLGALVTIKRVYVRNLRPPQQIEQARTAAAQQAQILEKARTQKTIDSTEAVSELFKQEMSAKANKAQNEALATSPQALQLKVAEAMAGGLRDMCKGASTCIVGGTVLDQFLAGVKR